MVSGTPKRMWFDSEIGHTWSSQETCDFDILSTSLRSGQTHVVRLRNTSYGIVSGNLWFQHSVNFFKIWPLKKLLTLQHTHITLIITLSNSNYLQKYKSNKRNLWQIMSIICQRKNLYRRNIPQLNVLPKFYTSTHHHLFNHFKLIIK